MVGSVTIRYLAITNRISIIKYLNIKSIINDLVKFFIEAKDKIEASINPQTYLSLESSLV